MGEEGCLTNEKFYNLEVSNNLQVNKFTDKIIYDFQELNDNGNIDLSKPLIFITKPVAGNININLKVGQKGQMIILVRTDNNGGNVNIQGNHCNVYNINEAAANNNLTPRKSYKLICDGTDWYPMMN